MSSPSKTIRTLFAFVIILLGIILVMLPLEGTAGTLISKIGLALIVAGVMTVFHEIVLRRTEIEDTVTALKESLLPQLQGVSATVAPIKEQLSGLNEMAENFNDKLALLTPEVIESFHRVKTEAEPDDLLLARTADAIYDSLRPAFDSLSDAAKLNDEFFFRNATVVINDMRPGDRILAICCRKSWEDDSRELVERYWELNKEKAAEGVSVRRVFVSDAQKRDDPDFGKELTNTIDRHRAYIDDLRTRREDGEDLSKNLKIKKIGRRLRDNLSFAPWLDPLFGFALISSRHRKVASLHRLVGSHLKGTLVENPLVYAVLERHFWEIWKQGEHI